MFDEFDRKIFQENEVVFRKGDEGDCAYLIEKGTIEIFVSSGTTEQRLSLFGKGELFGEVALLDQLPRTATARATENTVLIPIQRRVVANLLDNCDPILRHLLLVILERFRGAQTATSSQTPENQLQIKRQSATRGEATQKISLAHGITRALTRDEFILYYQPICYLKSGEIAGFEALIRWNHPTDGLVPPMDFIWLAEQTGLIRELGLWTLERACRDWPKLRTFTRGNQPFVSVNLSPNQLTAKGLVSDVKGIMDKYAMKPSELKLELTETVVVERPDQASDILNQLIGLGCTLALDDYGTGYSGLEHLQRYPIKTLKLDRAFIAPMLESEGSAEIVQSSIKLAHILNMRVVAEGIETEDVRAALLKLDCEYGQGWLFGKPIPLDKYMQSVQGA